MKKSTKLIIGVTGGFSTFFFCILLPILIVVIIFAALFSTGEKEEGSGSGDEDGETSSGISTSEVISKDNLSFINSYAFCLPLATDGGTIYITARYGQSGSNWSTIHTGTDFATPSSASVVAVADGTIVEVAYGDTYNGNYVVIKHTYSEGDESLTFYTEYLHMQDNSIQVSEGEEVVQGTVLGKEGSTGNVTGMHCHLEFSFSAPRTSSRGTLQLYSTAKDAEYYLYEGHVFDNYENLKEIYWTANLIS